MIKYQNAKAKLHGITRVINLRGEKLLVRNFDPESYWLDIVGRFKGDLKGDDCIECIDTPYWDIYLTEVLRDAV